MSCYEYEYGTIKLSTKEFSRVRRAFAESYNAWLDKCFNKAVSLYEPLKEYIVKNKKNKDFFGWSKNPVYDISHHYLEKQLHNEDETTLYKIMESLVSQKTVDGKTKYSIIKPTKKAFKHVSLSQNEYSDLTCYVSFIPEEKSFKWNVPENNHSVEHAWINILGKTFKQVFSKVEWSRGTGGVIFYNSEYNRENQGYDGAGGDMASKFFGPIGEKHKENLMKPRKHW